MLNPEQVVVSAWVRERCAKSEVVGAVRVMDAPTRKGPRRQARRTMITSRALSSALRGAAASQVLAYYTNCYDPSTSGPVPGSAVVLDGYLMV